MPPMRHARHTVRHVEMRRRLCNINPNSQVPSATCNLCGADGDGCRHPGCCLCTSSIWLFGADKVLPDGVTQYRNRHKGYQGKHTAHHGVGDVLGVPVGYCLHRRQLQPAPVWRSAGPVNDTKLYPHPPAPAHTVAHWLRTPGREQASWLAVHGVDWCRGLPVASGRASGRDSRSRREAHAVWKAAAGGFADESFLTTAPMHGT
jgi:hypothetical protein